MQSIDISPLEHVLKQCFADKNKYIKKDIPVESLNSLHFRRQRYSPDEK